MLIKLYQQVLPGTTRILHELEVENAATLLIVRRAVIDHILLLDRTITRMLDSTGELIGIESSDGSEQFRIDGTRLDFKNESSKQFFTYIIDGKRLGI